MREESKVLLGPENLNKHYEALFQEIDGGQIKLPMFQREFVWDKEQTANLIDSILRGFPIGTFVFWRTRDELRSYRELGNHKLPPTRKNEHASYVLDGQQRITSLYAIRKGIRIAKDGREIDYKDIYIDLDYSEAEDDRIVVVNRKEGRTYVSVHDVLTKMMGEFHRNFLSEKADLIENYKIKLTTYNFSIILITDYPIDIACDIFTRINTGGKTLTLFEIMVAMTYDDGKGFDLAERYEELVDGTDKDDICLAKAKFDTIPETTVMQVVAAITNGNIRSRDILKIRREVFIKNWDATKNSLFMAVDFIRSELGVPVSQILPYSVVLVPLAYFFFQMKNKKVSVQQRNLLEQFFYWTGLTGRYSSAAESKVGDDLKKMNDIAKNKAPKYPKAELRVDPRTIEETWFSIGNAFCKTILCLLASKHPKTFDTNGSVILDNSNLKIASSRNYHHFFPKDYLRKKQPEKEANWIANIVFIDAYSNQHKIRSKAPSSYMDAFLKENRKLKEGLQSHLIYDMNKFGILKDDYQTFLRARAEAIANCLNEKLMPE